MPTGYTAKVQKGEDTFGQFVWRCARAFGALVTMRDDPMGAPVPERFEIGDYYPQRIAEIEKELGRFRAMTDIEADLEVVKEHKKVVVANTERRERAKQERANYERMLVQVQAWEAPPEQQKLREFMISQLKDSISFDCSEVYQQPVPSIVGNAGPAWRQKRVTELKDDLQRARKSLREEEVRVAKRNAWIGALRESVPYEQPE